MRRHALLTPAIVILLPLAAAVWAVAARPRLEAVHLPRPPAINGDLAELRGAPHLGLMGGGRWKPALPGATYGGTTDLAARVYAGWDVGNLYLAVEVYDDQLVTGTPDKPWQGDCLVLAFDPAKDGGTAYAGDDSEFVLAYSREAAPTLLRVYPAGRAGVVAPAKVAVVKAYRPPQATDKVPMPKVRLTYELAIPWQELKSGGKPGVSLGFTLAVCDNDGAGRKGWLETTVGLIGAKEPGQFALLALQAPRPVGTVALQPDKQPGTRPPAAPAPADAAAPAPAVPATPQPLVVTAPVAPAPVGFAPQFANPEVIRFDGDCLTIRNEDVLLLSASLHYFRVPRAAWADRLGKLVQAGFNCVETPVPWNWHERREGSSDLTELEEFLTLAESMGLYVMVRVGPYIGVEWDAGGYPAWLAAKGVPYRSGAPEYLVSCDHWLSLVLPVVKKHQLTEGGRVVMLVVEAGPATANLYATARSAGIAVPIAVMGSEAARGQASQTAADLVDGISLFPRWNLAGAVSELTALRREETSAPLSALELGVGWFSRVGGQLPQDQPGVEPEQAEMAAKLALEQGAGIMNLYLGAGGSNPGYWGADWITTSYDCAAPISESGGLTPKYYRLRLVGALVRLFGPMLLRAKPVSGEAVAADAEGVTVTERANGNTAFLFVRPAQVPDNVAGVAYHCRVTYLDPATGQPVTIPQTGKITLGAREAKVLVANLPLAGMGLRYCTSEIAAIAPVGDRTVVVAYGESGTAGEVALTTASKPLVVGEALAQEWDEATKTLTVNYMFADEDRVVLVDNLELLLVSKERASRLWLAAQEGESLPVLLDAYLATAARMDKGALSLALECAPGASSVTAVVPGTPKSVTVDGKETPFAYDSTTRLLQVVLTTPEFYRDKPKPGIVDRVLALVKEGEPGLVQIFDAGRAMAEPVGAGTGWQQCKWEPLGKLGLLDNGYVCYHAEFEPAGYNYLVIESHAADPKLVFLNGKLVGPLCTSLKVCQADISERARLGQNSLDVIYLNQGRANAGARMAEPKGLRGVQMVNLSGPAPGGSQLREWRVRKAAALAAEPAEASPEYDDSGWSRVEVGSGPQQVFAGYRGLAWYRTRVNVDEASLAQKMAVLSFGGVDDAAWVYVNGTKVGEHVGAGKAFRFEVTPFLHPGANVVAVAVENRGGSGGMFQPVALTLAARTGKPVPAALVRERLVGEQNGYASPTFNDERWHILKLGDWKKQSKTFSDYDGIVWYRLKFRLPSRSGWHAPWFLRMAALGQATLYLNGQALGKYYPSGPQTDFYLPEGWLVEGKDNVIAVAVHSSGGPAGLTEARVMADVGHVVKDREVRVSF